MENKQADNLDLYEDMPIVPEDGLVPTLNKMGYMTTFLDPFSEMFVDYSTTCKKPVLEIGAAYGIASLKALSKGVTVVSNDLDPRHLKILERKCPEEYRDRLSIVVGDFVNTDFPANHFGAILTARVFHFMDGPTLRKALSRCYNILQENGKLFIVTDTLYMKDWQSFIPVFEQRIKDQIEWPGLVEDISFFGSKRVPQIPKLMHWLDQNTLKRELNLANFYVEEIAYLDRKDYPNDVRLDGRESIGTVAIKL